MRYIQFDTALNHSDGPLPEQKQPHTTDSAESFHYRQFYWIFQERPNAENTNFVVSPLEFVEIDLTIHFDLKDINLI